MDVIFSRMLVRAFLQLHLRLDDRWQFCRLLRCITRQQRKNFLVRLRSDNVPVTGRSFFAPTEICESPANVQWLDKCNSMEDSGLTRIVERIDRAIKRRSRGTCLCRREDIS